MSTHGAQDGEKTLYASEDGQVRVTGESLVLGSERWSIDSLASAEVVESKEMKWAGWPKLDSHSMPTFTAAGACVLAGVLFNWIASSSSGLVYWLVVALAAILYILAIIFLYITWQVSLPNTYTLQLGLKDSAGAAKAQKASYVWRDRLQAQSVEQAMLQAIAHKENSAGA
ncbi:MAG: hypothetical protein ABJA50_10705 [Chloroflexota bacterium]